MKYDKLNSIKEVKNIFVVEDIKFYIRINSYVKKELSNYESVTILNDSVIMIQNISNFIYDLKGIVTYNELYCEFTNIKYKQEKKNKIKIE